MFHPGPGIEQDQHGQQFQSSGQHVEDQHQFGGEAVVSEVPGGPYPCQAGTDVVQGSGHSSEVGLEIEPVQAHGQDGQEENQEIGDQEDVNGIEHFAVHGLPVHAHPLDPVGMEYLSQFQENGLAGEHDPAHLHPAAGAAGAGPHHHQEHQDGFGKAGPQVKIHGAEPGGGHDASHLEKGGPEGLFQGVEPVPDLPGDGQPESQDDAHIGPDFFHGQGFPKPENQGQIVEAEIHPEGDHEQGDDPLLDWRITGATVVEDAEAPGAGGTESDAQVVEPVHAGKGQQGDHQQGHAQVDLVEHNGGVPHPGHELGHVRTGAFRLHQIHLGAAPVGGHQHQDEHQHPHAPDPVGKAPPEQGGVGHGLHIAEDGGPGGGKAGDDFKHRIHIGRDLSGEHKGNGAVQAQEHPGQAHGHEPFPLIDGLVPDFPPAGHIPDGQGQEGQGKIDHPLVFSVNEGNQAGQQQQGSFGTEDPGQHPPDHRIIHGVQTPLCQDVFDFVEAQVGGDHDHRIPRLEGILAAGDDQFPFPDDAGDQHVLFDPHIRQFGADQGGFAVQKEFQGLHPAVHEPVQGLHIGFHTVAGGPDVLDDLLGSELFGVDDAVQLEPFDHVPEIHMVHLGDDFLAGMLQGVQGQDGVDFVHAGAGHEAVHAFQVFFPEQLFFSAVPAVDGGPGQGFHQFFAPGHIPFDDGHFRMALQEHLGQVVAELAAPHDHDVFAFVGADADFLEEGLGIPGHGDDGEDIPLLDHRIPVGDQDVAVPFDDAHQQVHCEMGNFLQGPADEHGGWGHPEPEHVDPVLGEADDFNGGREVQQPGNFLGGFHFRVDGHGQVQPLLEVVPFVGIMGTPDPGDGMALMVVQFGDDAGQKVHFVAFGDGDEHVRMGQIGLGQDVEAGTVAHDPHYIVIGGNIPDDGGVGVDDGNVVVFLGELGDDAPSHFPASYNYDLHG